MDPSRFDALIRLLHANPSRRGALRALFGGFAVAAINSFDLNDAEAGGKGNKNKNKQSKRKIVCYKTVLDAYMKSAVDNFVEAIEGCQPACVADKNSAACTECIGPQARKVVDAIALASQVGCGAQRVRRSNAEVAAGVTSRAAGLGKCNYAELNKCRDRWIETTLGTVVATAAACLATGGTGCGLAIGTGVAPSARAYSYCNEDDGCKKGHCRPGNLCCANGTDTACGGSCCEWPKSCVGEQCQCAPPYVECGSTCCNTGLCRECRGGTCESKCEGDAFCTGNGTCSNCPPEGCGDG